ncbi:MAG TPA: dTDP-glucose 4,6-dehydratase [Candidatus Marinimicrobia bacterium]|jgi:dTDP-glucose 4,6-dehydratase|nr:dTDP-glucose 4,6-dehydratase [Candidatus Neomarinimicrobiota bacterium]HIB03921.1 dTDP-glucose 4,6-dehydratase [Candidatus Neomarinimicrobiota bacterium]HIB70340.1 dTDP-glucose 4,6-dehydratase [Candidatus Neomarinimicrobiota bacterium]HIB96410.1 dTDP-glucose 4,6-dehydratase [Candidatus Neomarinimicrobiota bacterium]HIN61216.1 dTDP-glucose 4,6-dehydratase [Candidatus Neomarinimicrobiota bacterium]
MKIYLVTGGSGFIGSNFVRYMLQNDPDCHVLNLDKLTYAGNPANLSDIELDDRYTFIHGDICDRNVVWDIFRKHSPQVLINFAAETHVDRSIGSPDDFIKTDVFGVFTLLEASKEFGVDLFLQISTDEVYGSIAEGSFSEGDPLLPSSPYSASKAGGDRLAYSYYVTYNLPVIITRASNNYGPFQYPEKLISLFVTNALEDRHLPVYGDGKNVRDWLYVSDHCSAIHFIIENGELGEVYNVGGGNELQNIHITHQILELLGKSTDLIKFVEDRKGHDLRYSLDCSKLNQLGWMPKHSFDEALAETIQWYQSNEAWWVPIKSGEFREYYKTHYNVAYESE